MKYKIREETPCIVEESANVVSADPLAAVERVRHGLPTGEFDALREMLGLTVEELGRKTGLSVATLSRRRARRQPLDRDHSDRLVRYARLYWLAVDLFEGDEATARAWLKRPAPGLGGETPLDFAETEVGAREVEDLIGRLEHGVYV
ncbi:MAG: DUF2384 domain-containing protein [Opitutales bacterium]|nr:DUF2384 domain-containing protein [Opitutales bacterium]